jgi:hypothetical protein
MKTMSIPLLVLLASTALLRAETEPPAPSSSAVLLNPIPDGTPAPEPAPVPEYEVKPADVLESRSIEQDGRTITIQEIKPIDLPPPPEENHSPLAPIATPDFAQRLAEFRAQRKAINTLHLSAKVYRSPGNPPRSLVTCWPGGIQVSFTFWSSADFSLIAGGIQSFADTTGQTHHLFMSWGNVEQAREQAAAIRRGVHYTPPNPPAFPNGPATFQVVGESPAPEALVPIQSLHDLYNQKQAELHAAYQGREHARLQKEEELRLNPPQPQDITLNFWRTEKPAEAAQEGGAK